MMSNYSICLHFFCVYSFCFFVLIILNSFSKKACCSVLAHCLLNSCNIRDVLNKTNHRTIALRCEFIIISCFNSCKFEYSIFGCFCNWILSNIIFNLISKIRKEPLSVIQFNIHSLIVDHGPLSFDYFIITNFSTFAENCLSFETFQNVYFVRIE